MTASPPVATLNHCPLMNPLLAAGWSKCCAAKTAVLFRPGSVIYQVQLGAYGRGFYSNELAPALQTIVTETLQAHGYRPTPDDGEYQPLPVTLAPEAEVNMVEKLATISPVMTEFGQALLLRDVLTAVIGHNQPVSEWQAEQLVKNGRISQALRQLGYQTE